MAYILSVDGGGSKTCLCIYNSINNKKIYTTIGSSNYKNIGLKLAKKKIKEGINKIIDEGKIDLKQIEAAVFGFSGNDTEDDQKKLENIIGELEIKNTYVCNDAEIALRTYTLDPGIVIISGTGSIAYGIDGCNNEMRVGGWGCQISDLGSGYWISRQILEKLVLYCEDLYSFDYIFSLIKEHLQISEYRKIPSYLSNTINSPKDIAAMTKLIVTNMNNSMLAQRVVEQAVDYLVKLVEKIYIQLSLSKEKKCSIVMSGSVVTNPIISELFIKEIRRKITYQNISFIVAQKKPVDGGINIGIDLLRKGR
ncbi:N-acetylglucosamine kinase [Vallitalea maricola]|uniref:BadF/BadG/BcrA/BcrD ATPase family protein n=1 Tax=Vallitalea maricola TaxID=3074433 RepID=A0ACB5UJG1_9FIRM|nr:BadF/BadG/BcrA/BcrD ATPase family protein [Vallitalea sp. AN17-2]